jgi:hypothetical protein
MLADKDGNVGSRGRHRDMSVEGQRSVQFSDWDTRPRSKEGIHPRCISSMRNVVTPMKSGLGLVLKLNQ